MGVIYILTVFIMLILHMLVFKKEKKQNLVKWVAVSIVIFLCYNIVTCVILSFLKIPSTLISLSIVNVIVNILLAIKIYKDKKIQKYGIDIVDILVIIAILIIGIVVVKKQYGEFYNIKHIIVDAAVHYFAAEDFSNHSHLLLENNSDVQNLWNLGFLMPGSYINIGIIFKILNNIGSSAYFYQIYLTFDIVIWLLSGVLMYGLLIKSKQPKKKILPAIFSIIYMIGYPLNSVLYGFSYLAIGLNIIITILIIMKENLNKNYKYILMFFLNFGLLFSYYLFAPVVYLAILLHIILKAKKENKKIISLENVLNISFTMVIPGIFWLLYFVIFQILKTGIEPQYGTVINIEGDIYNNLVTNNIVFIILAIYYIIDSLWRNKKRLINYMFIVQFVFMQILFIGVIGNIVSTYYFFKTYYFLWILSITIGYYAINRIMLINKKAKYITYVGVSIYIIGIIFAMISNQSLFIFDIYKVNSYEVQLYDRTLMTYDEIELLEYYKDNIIIGEDEFDNTTSICPSPFIYGRQVWTYAITKNPQFYKDMQARESVNVDTFVESNKKYFLLLRADYSSKYNEIYNKIEENNLQIMFENGAGMILEKI